MFLMLIVQANNVGTVFLYRYIFKCEQDPSKSGNWQQDGLKWQQNCSSTVQVGPALMLKRLVS